MWPNPKETAALVTFTEEILNGKLHLLCSDKKTSPRNGTKSYAGYWHFKTEVRKKAYESLSCCLKETVIKNKEVLLLVDLNRYYQHLLTEFRRNQFINITSNSQKLEERIKKHNGDDIIFNPVENQKREYIVFTIPVFRRSGQ